MLSNTFFFPYKCFFILNDLDTNIASWFRRPQSNSKSLNIVDIQRETGQSQFHSVPVDTRHVKFKENDSKRHSKTSLSSRSDEIIVNTEEEDSPISPSTNLESTTALPCIGPHLVISSVNRFHESGDTASSIGSLENLQTVTTSEDKTDGDETKVVEHGPAGGTGEQQSLDLKVY